MKKMNPENIQRPGSKTPVAIGVGFDLFQFPLLAKGLIFSFLISEILGKRLKTAVVFCGYGLQVKKKLKLSLHPVEKEDGGGVSDKPWF